MREDLAGDGEGAFHFAELDGAGLSGLGDVDEFGGLGGDAGHNRGGG